MNNRCLIPSNYKRCCFSSFAFSIFTIISFAYPESRHLSCYAWEICWVFQILTASGLEWDFQKQPLLLLSTDTLYNSRRVLLPEVISFHSAVIFFWDYVDAGLIFKLVYVEKDDKNLTVEIVKSNASCLTSWITLTMGWKRFIFK